MIPECVLQAASKLHPILQFINKTTNENGFLAF